MEKRKNLRRKTLKGGSILFGFAPAVDCVIRNLSEVGACLQLGSASGIPDQFILIIKPESIRRSCGVAWRRTNRIGVSFIQTATRPDEITDTKPVGDKPLEL